MQITKIKIEISLSCLQAGGLFKIGQTPFSSGDRWISLVLMKPGQRSIISNNVYSFSKKI